MAGAEEAVSQSEGVGDGLNKAGTLLCKENANSNPESGRFQSRPGMTYPSQTRHLSLTAVHNAGYFEEESPEAW